ncbi:MAG: hypothetical protein KJO07_01025 [Deltaproteobacteria bacterium]|nr:hypothetical protein [Deltaproteobacteria bacterium]
MKRNLSVLIALLFLGSASIAVAAISQKRLVGSWQGQLVMSFNGDTKSENVKFVFAKDGGLQVTYGGKEEASKYKVSGNEVHFYNKDGSKKEAVLHNIKLSKSALSGDLKPEGEGMPPGVSIKLKLSRSK